MIPTHQPQINLTRGALGDVLVAYRTIPMRLKRVMTARTVLRATGTKWTETDVDQQMDLLRARMLPGLGSDPVTEMANTVLHHTWEPSARQDLGIHLCWKGPHQQAVDFAEDDVREDLTRLVEETLRQFYSFIQDQL